MIKKSKLGLITNITDQDRGKSIICEKNGLDKRGKGDHTKEVTLGVIPCYLRLTEVEKLLLYLSKTGNLLKLDSKITFNKLFVEKIEEDSNGPK